LLHRLRDWWSGETANPVKRVQFGHGITPWLFVLPQLAVVVIFFYWPSAQAVTSSFYIEDPFGFGSTFVGMERKFLWSRGARRYF
jgi:sn-glycerol 3-phosphate transport system permease protein